MRSFLVGLCFVFVAACGGGQDDHFDFASISDAKVEFCKKVKPLVILGKSTCPSCQQAIDSAKVRAFDYRFVELDPQTPGKSAAELIAANDELKKMLQKNNIDPTSLSTVPQIFFGETYVGGFDELKEKLLKPIDKLLGAQNVPAAVKNCLKK